MGVGPVAEVIGFRGKIEFDASRPDGAPQKLLDVWPSTLWLARADRAARRLVRMYADFVAHYPELRRQAESTAPRSAVRDDSHADSAQ